MLLAEKQGNPCFNEKLNSVIASPHRYYSLMHVMTAVSSNLLFSLNYNVILFVT